MTPRRWVTGLSLGVAVALAAPAAAFHTAFSYRVGRFEADGNICTSVTCWYKEPRTQPAPSMSRISTGLTGGTG